VLCTILPLRVQQHNTTWELSVASFFFIIKGTRFIVICFLGRNLVWKLVELVVREWKYVHKPEF
jgi:hypothetical protein